MHYLSTAKEKKTNSQDSSKGTSQKQARIAIKMKKALSLIMVILLALIVPNAAKTTTLVGKVGETVGRLFHGLFPNYGKPTHQYPPIGGAYPQYRPLAGNPRPHEPVSDNKKQF